MCYGRKVESRFLVPSPRCGGINARSLALRTTEQLQNVPWHLNVDLDLFPQCSALGFIDLTYTLTNIPTADHCLREHDGLSSRYQTVARNLLPEARRSVIQCLLRSLP